jgi:ribosome-associated translation inhibitor RaiA
MLSGVAPWRRKEEPMTARVRFRGIESSAALREHATRRVHLQLSRFGQQITAVSVFVTDVNGPRGGTDKQCHVTIRGGRLGVVDLTETHADPFAAVDLALERASRAVGRSLERARGPRRPTVARRAA